MKFADDSVNHSVDTNFRKSTSFGSFTSEYVRLKFIVRALEESIRILDYLRIWEFCERNLVSRIVVERERRENNCGRPLELLNSVTRLFKLRFFSRDNRIRTFENRFLQNRYFGLFKSLRILREYYINLILRTSNSRDRKM